MHYALDEAKLLKLRSINEPDAFQRYFNDFHDVPLDDTTGNQTLFTSVADAGSTLKACGVDVAGGGGWLQIPTDGDDSDEQYLSSASEAWKFDTTKKLYFEARVQFVKGTTDGKGGFIIGLSDTVAANSIVDAGTIMASFDGACFIKEEDATGIAFVTSNAATQTRTASIGSYADATTYTLGFFYDPNDGVTAKITPIYNGQVCLDSSGNVIQHSLTISGLEEMHLLMGAKAHEAAEQSFRVDRVTIVQEFAR